MSPARLPLMMTAFAATTDNCMVETIRTGMGDGDEWVGWWWSGAAYEKMTYFIPGEGA